MGKRKRVPQALHSELSEYASLLRALRTNDTLDVAKHITLPPPPKEKRKPRKTKTPAVDAGGSVPSAQPASPASPAPQRSPRKHAKKRDTWTRWPLLVEDVHVPEWGFDDEIEALTRSILHNNPHPPLPLPGPASPEADDAPPYLPALAHAASNFLSSVLALVAHHTPARPQSMQDRLNPIGWQMVLDIVSCDPAFDETMLNNVKARMEAIYGPYETPAIERAKTAALMDDLDKRLLAFPPEPGRRQMKRKKVSEEEEVHSDDLDS
ncbi:hypothetical protein C8J57DRAFT_1211736 [Mycena rebaudengoi]|nr:hypothetical protein C8J57DRAFT_1211736 [Mycena rebaudengoi]